MEEFSEVGHQKGTFLLCYQLSLSSSAPLKEQDVREALIHLYRKVPCLRVCYGSRDGVIWFREVTNQNIDFQVIANGNVWETMNCLRTYSYNSETGPLWCARLIPATEEVNSGYDHHPDFPHCYHLMVGFHHGIVDGFTAMKTCGFIVTLLNDVIAGNAIRDEEQLGEFVGHEETNRLILEKKVLLEGDVTLLNQLVSNSESKKDVKSIFRDTFKSSEPTTKVRTRSVTHFLEPDITNKFIKRCRAEGVTVHSAFTTLASLAMVDLLVEKGVCQHSYNIINNHVINIRRYWSGDVSSSLGCHIVAPLRLYTDVARLSEETFWDVARSTHKDLQEALQEGVILRNQAIAQITSSAKMDAEGFFYPSLPADYSTSNLGDVTALISEGGEHVRPTRVLRSVSIHHTNASWSHLFNTFKGRFIHVLDYNNATIAKDLAEQYSDNIFKHLLEVIGM